MDLKHMFLAQLEREAVATRRTLEHVPETALSTRFRASRRKCASVVPR